MKFISDAGACEDYGELNKGDVLRTEAFYNDGEYTQLKMHGRLDPQMGISFLYIGMYDENAPKEPIGLRPNRMPPWAGRGNGTRPNWGPPNGGGPRGWSNSGPKEMAAKMGLPENFTSKDVLAKFGLPETPTKDMLAKMGFPEDFPKDLMAKLSSPNVGTAKGPPSLGPPKVDAPKGSQSLRPPRV